MRNRVIVVVSVAAVGVLLIWALAGRPDRQALVRIAYPPIVASLPVFIAEDRGLFTQNEVDSEIFQFSNSNDMVNALVAGQIDLLPAVSLIPLLHLEIQFPGTVRIFSHSRMVPERAFDSIITLQDSPVRELKDLEGYKVGVFPGTSATNMLKAFFSKLGIEPNKVTYVAMAPSAHLASLDSRAVEALFTYEPVTTAAAASGRYRQLFGSVYSDLQNPCPIGASVVSRRFERVHPEMARRSVAAIDLAVIAMREHPEQSKLLLTNRLGFSAAISQQVNIVDVTLSDEINVDALQKFIDFLFECGEIKKRIDARPLVEPTH